MSCNTLAESTVGKDLLYGNASYFGVDCKRFVQKVYLHCKDLSNYMVGYSWLKLQLTCFFIHLNSGTACGVSYSDGFVCKLRSDILTQELDSIFL